MKEVNEFFTSEEDNKDILNNLVKNSIGKDKKVKKKFSIKKCVSNFTIATLISIIAATSLTGSVHTKQNGFVSSKRTAAISTNYKFDNIDFTNIPTYYFNKFDLMSDSDNVYVHSISNAITNEIKHKLDEKEYKILCNALKGKKIIEIINEDGTFNIDIIDSYFSSEFFKEISDSEIEKLKEKIKNVKFYDEKNCYTNVILESAIAEIVSDNSGFDAIVLENNGDYFITNTCCGENDKEDKVMIIYDVVNQLVGNKEFYEEAASMLFGKGTPYELPEEYNINSEDIINAEKYYNGQRLASYKLIKKYLLEGKNIKLGGFSLGGGIMLDTYVELYKQNPDFCKNLSISLYNPYIALIEGQNSEKEIKKFINDCKSSIKIYSASGDIVSQFNNIINLFGDSVIYLKGNEEIEYHLKDFNLINLVMSENARHSIKGVSYDSFDESGNIIEYGKQITLNEIANGKVESNSLELLLKDAFKKDINSIRNDIEKIDLGENNYMKKHIVEMYDALLNYFEKNIGNFEYEELIDTISPFITKIMHESVEKKVGGATLISDGMNSLSNEENINNHMKEYFLTQEGKNKIKLIVQSLLKEKTNTTVDQLTNLGTNIYLDSDKTGINNTIYNISNFIEEFLSDMRKKTQMQSKVLNNLLNNQKIVKSSKEKDNVLDDFKNIKIL